MNSTRAIEEPVLTDDVKTIARHVNIPIDKLAAFLLVARIAGYELRRPTLDEQLSCPECTKLSAEARAALDPNQ